MTRACAVGCDLVVLCGGLGTRLRPAINDRPKSLAMIDDRPFLDWLLAHFAHHGIARIILCTGYLGECIDQRYAGVRHPYELVTSREPFSMGTAGAVKYAAALIRSDPFIVVNGDSLIDINPNELLEFHAAKQGWATITLASAGARNDVGFVTIDSHAQITAFTEKRPGMVPQYHNAGVYVFGQAVLGEIPEHRPSSIETDLLPALLSKRVFGFVSNLPLYDIGTPKRLAEFIASRPRWHGNALSEATLGFRG